VIDEIREAAQRLNKLIDDMFTLSRIESEEPGEHAAVDLNAIAEEACNEYQILAQNRNLGLALRLADGAVPMVGDQDQLFRLVANLVDNAIHYTEQGTITVATHIQKNQAVLEVTDTGIGIPEAHLGSIFERFYRTAQARTMRRDGTGLGLAISKAIVEQHRGTIKVQSAVGEGTTVQVAFPIHNNHLDQAHVE
jgi:two-component system phosphate regulon sensor histidine kinase PhoR